MQDFLQALPPAIQEQASALSDLSARLQACLEQIQQSWPHLPYTPSRFLAYMAEQYAAQATKQTLEAWLERLQPADLYLAFCCSKQDPAAIETLEQQYAGVLRQTATRFASNAYPQEDLLQILREKLFVETPTKQARIRAYGGQGPLQSWLRVTATRTFLDCVRTGAQQKREFGDHDSLILNTPDGQMDVELDFLKREYRSQFKAAFEEATRSLNSSERNLLRQNLIAGLSIDQIGALYHIHRSTAARRVARARETLLERTREGLMKRLELSHDEFDSLMQLIHSRLEVSLHRLLKTQTLLPDEPGAS